MKRGRGRGMDRRKDRKSEALETGNICQKDVCRDPTFPQRIGPRQPNRDKHTETMKTKKD